MILAIIIIAIIVVILLSTYKVEIKLKLKNNDIYFLVKFMALKGIINYKYEIPYIDMIEYKDKLLLKVTEVKTSEEKNVTRNKLSFGEIKNLTNLLLKYKEVYRDVIQYMLKALKIEKLDIYVRSGVNDASMTALIYGFINSFIGTIISIISRKMDIKKVNINTVPDFNRNIVDINFNCIIIFNLVNIIIVKYKFFKIKKVAKIQW